MMSSSWTKDNDELEEEQRIIKLLKETIMNEMGMATASKEPQVRMQINKISISIDELLKSIEMLDERLRMVTRESSPKVQEEETERAALVPMAFEIETFNNRINNARMRVEDIVERLEI